MSERCSRVMTTSIGSMPLRYRLPISHLQHCISTTPNHSPSVDAVELGMLRQQAHVQANLAAGRFQRFSRCPTSPSRDSRRAASSTYFGRYGTSFPKVGPACHVTEGHRGAVSARRAAAVCDQHPKDPQPTAEAAPGCRGRHAARWTVARPP